MEDIEKRKILANNKRKEKEIKLQAKEKKQDNQVFSLLLKNLIGLGPDLIYKSNSISPRLL